MIAPLRFATLLFVVCSATASFGVLINVASDDYQSGFNFTGGGFGTHTTVNGPGGSFQQSGGRAIDGGESLGVFSFGGETAIGRAITNSALFSTAPVGTLSLSLRFDVPNNQGFKGFNLRNTTTGGFTDGELISVGLVAGNNNSLAVTDFSGGPTQVLDFGFGILGEIIDVTLSFDTRDGSYSLEASRRGDAALPAVSGTLKNPSDFVPRSISIIHGDDAGFGANVYADNLLITAVPEVSAAIALPALLGGFFAAKPRRSGRDDESA